MRLTQHRQVGLAIFSGGRNARHPRDFAAPRPDASHDQQCRKCRNCVRGRNDSRPIGRYSGAMTIDLGVTL